MRLLPLVLPPWLPYSAPSKATSFPVLTSLPMDHDTVHAQDILQIVLIQADYILFNQRKCTAFVLWWSWN